MKQIASCFCVRYLAWVGSCFLMPSGQPVDHWIWQWWRFLAGPSGSHKPRPFWAASPSDGPDSSHHGCRAQRCRWAGAGWRPGTPSELWQQHKFIVVQWFIFSLWATGGSITDLKPVKPNSTACRNPPIPVRKLTAPEPSDDSLHTCERRWSHLNTMGVRWRGSLCAQVSVGVPDTWKGPWMLLKHFSSKSRALSASPSSSQPIANIPLGWKVKASINCTQNFLRVCQHPFLWVTTFSSNMPLFIVCYCHM